MTRPRSQQINDPSTRYTKLKLSVPTPGDLVTSLTGVDYINFLSNTVTQIDGGSEFACPGVIIATGTDPYILSPLQSFQISVDGGAPATVTLQAGDFVILDGGTRTTAHRVAARINSDIGINVASRTEDGKLKLESPTTGVNSNITISGLNTILNALGFGLVTSVSGFGQDLTRGVITKSPDGLGGYLYSSWDDGRKLLASSKNYYPNAYLVGSGSLPAVQNIPAGQPVYARLSKNATPGLNLAWYTKCTGSDKITSSFSNFTALGAGETLTIEILDPVTGLPVTSFTSTFAAAPTTVQDVADVINAAADAVMSNLHGKVISSNSAPYFCAGNMVIKLNGLSPISVTFAESDRSVSDLVSRINAAIAVAGQAAQGQAYSIGNYIAIKSLLPIGGGPTSTVEIVNFSNESIQKSIGFGTGLYKGWFFCRAVGAEIEISSPCPTDVIYISGTARSNLGLSAYPVSPNPITVVDRFIPCEFPIYDSDTTPASSLTLLVPEYMEAGDIPDYNFTEERLTDLTSNNTTKYPNTAFSTSASMAGQQARLAMDGKLPASQLPYFVGPLKAGKIHFPDGTSQPAMFYQYKNGGYDLFFETKRSASVIGIRNYIQDDASTGETFQSNNAYTDGTSWYADDAASQSSVVSVNRNSYSVSFRFAGGASPFSLDKTFDLTSNGAVAGVDYEFILRGNNLINFESNTAKISDVNIAATTTNQYYAFTSGTASNGDKALRLHDSVVENSVFKFMNARQVITCGDGVNTFGDFNGPTALVQVAAFLNGIGDFRPAIIHMKAGTYFNTSKVVFNRSIVLTGDGSEGNGTVIQPPAADDNIEVGGDLVLSNITINSASGKKSIITIGGRYLIENCNLTDIQIWTGYGIVRNSYIGGATKAIDLKYMNDPQGPIVFDSCVIEGFGTDSQTFTITGVAGSCVIPNVTFRSCHFILADYTPVAAGGGYTLPYMSTNTGLVELIPANNGRSPDFYSNPNGLVVDNLIYDGCKVEATMGTANCIIQVCSAQTNKVKTDYGAGKNWGQINNLSFRDSTFIVNLAADAISDATSYFAVGHGVRDLTINNCDFYPKTPSSTGRYGFLPEWFSYSASLSPMTDYVAGIALATYNCNINNTRINDISLACGLSTKFSFDIMTCTGNSLNVDGFNIAAPTGTNTLGDGDTRSGLWNIFVETSNTYPNFSLNRSTKISHVNLKGKYATGYEWSDDSIIKIAKDAQNVHLDDVVTSNWTSSVAAHNLVGIYFTDSISVSITNCKIDDVNYGIQGNATAGGTNGIQNCIISNNYIISGGYRIGNENSCIWIWSYSDSLHPVKSLIIDGNSLVDADTGVDTTYAYIDLRVNNGSDPSVKVTNNRMNNILGRTLIAYRPYVSGMGDQEPMGYFYGNGGSYPLPTSTLIEVYRRTGGSYLYLDPTKIATGTLLGLETESNYVEVLPYQGLQSNAGTVVKAPVLSSTKQITNLPTYTRVYASYNINCISTVFTDWIYYLQYSYDGISYSDLTSSELGSVANSAPNIRTQLTIGSNLDLGNNSTVYFRLVISVSGAGSVTSNFNATFQTQKLNWTDGAKTLHNHATLKIA